MNDYKSIKTDILPPDIIRYEKEFIKNPYNGIDYIIRTWVNVEFLRDFGPWNEGEKLHLLSFDPITARLYDDSADGMINPTGPYKECGVVITPRDKPLFGSQKMILDDIKQQIDNILYLDERVGNWNEPTLVSLKELLLSILKSQSVILNNLADIANVIIL